MSETLALVIIKEIVGVAAEPLRRKLSAAILGEPLERALRKPTASALSAAVSAVLGADATEEHRRRATSILETFWTGGEMRVRGIPPAGTVTEALYNIVAAGMARALAPVTDLPGYEATSSLRALSEELNVSIAPDVFAAAFTTAWFTAICEASLTNDDLRQFALLLLNEQQLHEIKALRAGLETELVGKILAAILSLREEVLQQNDVTTARQREWFERYIAPTHRLMEEISDDYQTGFGETLTALRSGEDLDICMQRLEVMRRRKYTGRLSLDFIAKRLKTLQQAGTLVDATLDAPLLAYIEAVEIFKQADSPLGDSFFSHYLGKYNKLVRDGEDPHVRSNYQEISGPANLERSFAAPIELIVDELLPERWEFYLDAYYDLEDAVLAGPASPPRP